MIILLRFTGPPVPITARMHSTPQQAVISIYVCILEDTYLMILEQTKKQTNKQKSEVAKVILLVPPPRWLLGRARHGHCNQSDAGST
eukprot:3220855-Pyramimonas_sp.AAC.1